MNSEKMKNSQTLRKQRVVQAAIELICEDDFTSLNLNHVVAKARTSKSTIYELFGDKEGLIKAMANTVMFNSRAMFEKSLPRELPVEVLLLRYINAYLDICYTKEYVAIMRILYALIPESKEIGEYYLKHSVYKVIDMLECYLDDKSKDGTLVIPDTKLAAKELIGSMMWYQQSEILCHGGMSTDKESLQKEIRLAVQAFVRVYTNKSTQLI